MLRSIFLVSTSTLGCAAAVSLLALSASSPALADFVCTAPTSNPLACTNSTTAAAPFTNNATGTDQSATTTNSGTANGFATQTTGGGDASVTNSGTNLLNGMLAQTTNGGNATATNSGINTGDNVVALTFTTGNAAANNSGSIGNASSLDFSFLQARAIGTGNATATNSGSVAGGVAAVTLGGGTAAATNSGNTPSSLVAITLGGGDATATNSGSASGIAAVAAAGGNATVINSGVSTSNNVITVSGVVTLSGGIAAIAAGGNATLINTGVSTNTGGAALLAAAAGNAAVINSGMANGGIDVIANGVANVTNVVGGRVIGPIDLGGVGGNVINFQGGNWLFTIATAGGPTTINTGGAPFVVSGPFSGRTSRGARSDDICAGRSIADEFHRRNFRNAARPLRRHEHGGGRWSARLRWLAELSRGRSGASGIFRHSIGGDVLCVEPEADHRQGATARRDAVLRHHRLGERLWRRAQAARRRRDSADDR